MLQIILDQLEPMQFCVHEFLSLYLQNFGSTSSTVRIFLLSYGLPQGPK
jgi:hypothetical protein